MTTKYFATLTNQGAALLANATALGTKLNITQMAVGDGNGTLPVPDPAQTKLINQTRIAAINSLNVDANDAGQIIAEQIIPENEGGFFIREIGLFNDDGILIAVANCPETYKPLLAEGSGRTQTIRMILVVSSTSAITLKIDPSVVLATRKYVDDKVIEVKGYADDLMKKHLAEANPHNQYPLIANALKEMADAGLVSKVLENLRLRGGVKDDAIGRLIGCKIFTSSGTYTPSSDAKFIVAELQGGGGGGGGVGTRAASGSMSIGASGGGGGYGKFLITSLASSYAITVGAGGSAGAASSSTNTTTTGSKGGNTTLGTVATATGGDGAASGVATAPGLTMVAGRSAGGTASGTGLIQTILGGNSKYGFTLTSSAGSSGAGGKSYYGDGGQEALSQLDNTPQSGSAGNGYGSGGSGAISSGTGAGAAGGKGADGLVVIWEYA